MTLKLAGVYIAAITFLSLAGSTPVYFMAQIKRVVEFQTTLDYEDILICKSTFSKAERVAYKTGSCVFQFLIPLWIIVSISKILFGKVVENFTQYVESVCTLNACFSNM